MWSGISSAGNENESVAEQPQYFPGYLASLKFVPQQIDKTQRVNRRKQLELREMKNKTKL